MTFGRGLGPAVVLALGVWACTRGPAAPVRSPPPEPAPQEPTRPPGSPHLEDIEGVVLDPQGHGAITFGPDGARLWTSLDGQSEPIMVPVARGRDRFEQVDLRSEGDTGWRLAVRVGDEAQLLEADRWGSIHAVDAYEGASSIALLPGRRTLVAQRDAVILRDAEGGERSLAIGGPARLLLTPKRDAVVAVLGDWRATEVLQYWQDDPHMSVFEGAFVPLSLEDGGGLAAAGSPIPFTAAHAPGRPGYALAPNGRQLSFLKWRDLEVEGEEMLEVDIETVDLREGTRSRIEVDRFIAWVAYTEGSVLQWEGEPARDPPWEGAEGGTRLAGVTVRVERNWLFVRDAKGSRYLGARRFQPHAVAFDPTGQRQAWVVNAAEFGPPSLYLTRLGEEAIGTSLELSGLGPVTALTWPEPGVMLLADREGGLHRLDPSSGAHAVHDHIDGEPTAIEHDAASGLSLIHDAQGALAVVPWDDGQPLPAFSLEPLTSQSWRVGLLRGGDPGVWVLGPTGLATASLEQLRVGMAPSFEPLDSPPQRVFDVAWTSQRERIVDWGDRWEVSGSATHQWLRDTPVFGPLRPAPDGAALMTLPECDDTKWRVAVHPSRASELSRGASWLLAVERHADVQWSPDASLLAVAEGTHGGRIVDVATGKDVQRWHGGSFVAREEEPPSELALVGWCRTLDDVANDEERERYGDEGDDDE